MPRFSIMFRTDPAPPDEIDAALEEAGIELVADYGSSPPDEADAEYQSDTRVIALVADTADVAGRAVADAVEAKAAGFKLLKVTPEK